jgi:hypothetical protein
MFYRQITRLGALQNLIHVGGGAARDLRNAHSSIGHQTPVIDPFSHLEHARQALLQSHGPSVFSFIEISFAIHAIEIFGNARRSARSEVAAISSNADIPAAVAALHANAIAASANA